MKILLAIILLPFFDFAPVKFLFGLLAMDCNAFKLSSFN